MLVVPEREQLPVADARAGNAEAWKTLFRRYRLPLYVYVFELLRDEQASLDLVQETQYDVCRAWTIQHLAAIAVLSSSCGENLPSVRRIQERRATVRLRRCAHSSP